MRLVVLIGASGSGKTAIAGTIAARFPDKFSVFHFDRIGVPSAEQMIAEYGSGEGWQRAKTFEWMARLGASPTPGRPVLFEGQTRLSFLAEAADTAGIAYLPLLVDCDDDTRMRRLTFERRKPELANSTMMAWAQYLRREALDRGCAILHTSQISLDESVEHVLKLLDPLRGG